MKHFLVILVVSMFLGSAARAAQAQDTQGSVAPSRAETEDRKVGFVGEQKTPGEKNKSDVQSGTVPPSRAETEDRKVGFTGEQKTPDNK